MNVSVIILTFNSEKTIEATLESAFRVSDDIHIVDSFSTDKTQEIVPPVTQDDLFDEILASKRMPTGGTAG